MNELGIPFEQSEASPQLNHSIHDILDPELTNG